MSTASQIAANKSNSLLSTGPSSDSGKQIASRNALKHGLSGPGPNLPEAEQAAAKQRTLELIATLKPTDSFEHTLVEQIACEETRAESCRARIDAHRDLLARRAVDFWQKDRRLAAEFLARGLSKRPEIVSRQLQQTKQGNELLIEYWHALAGALYKQGDWDDQQRSIALDLMGVPIVLRNGHTKLDTREGYTGPQWLGETVAYHLSILQEQQPALDELDGHEQEMAIYGLEPTPDADLKLLRRYESAALRRMQWAYRQLLDRQKGRQPRAPRAARSAPKTAMSREELREQARKQDEELDALRYQTWQMMEEAGIHTELCSEALMRDATFKNVHAEPEPAVITPPKPTTAPPASPQFVGNRKARRAAELKARKARRA